MQFNLLGNVTVADGAREIAIPGVKVRAVLALLLVRRGETVRAERLADDLWGDDIPAGYHNALQSIVSRLRRALGTGGSCVVTDNDGYRIDIAADDLDVHRFEAAVADAQRDLAEGRHAEASSALRDALALWTGPALHGIADEGVLRREAMRLDELRLTALEDRIDADLHLGRHSALVAELTALTAEHPLRERLHGLLMLALYRCGRQSEALRAFQDARAILGDELGLEPGPELRALEAAILDHDPSLDLADDAAVTAAPARRTNLAAGLSSFVGRRADVELLDRAITSSRLVTVVGPGGAGKTRLAVETARERTTEHTWFVDLAPLSAPLLVAETIAATLGATDGMALAGQAVTPEQRVIEQCRSDRTLIVLDNCEHLVAEAARVADTLLRACPSLRIVATSREALGVPGETVWPMPPMTTDDAVELFCQRAHAASGFEIGADTAPIVSDLCMRLDGLPLAIELAAGRSRAFPVQQLAARLDDRFRLLTGGSRTALPRQQTLRAVVDWSYDLLFDQQQRVFDRLSVFAGGCTLEAAEAVCSGDDIDAADVADIIGHLVDKSLVVADHTGVATGGEVRYRLLQTLALFGQERLAATGEAHAVRDRHAAHFGRLCRRGHAAFRGDRQEQWLSEVEREVENLHVAMTWTVEQGDALTSQTNLSGLGWSWWFAGRGDDGWRWLTAALHCPGPTTPVARAGTAIWACYVGVCAGVGGDTAIDYGEEAVRLARETDDTDLLVQCLSMLADARATRGDVAHAIELLDEVIALLGDRADDWGRVTAINAAGRRAELGQDLALAARLMIESLEIYEPMGVEWAVAVVGGNVMLVAERLGDVATAIAFGERARRAAVRLRLGGYDAMLQARLGTLALWEGRLEDARRLHEGALALADEVSYATAKATATAGRAIGLRLEGSLEDARRMAETSLRLHRSSGMTSSMSVVLVTLGLLAELRGDLTSAADHHRDAARHGLRRGDDRAVSLALEGLAGVAIARDDALAAARLLGAAIARRDAAGGAPAGPASDGERIRRAVTAALDDEPFELALAVGRSMAFEQLTAAEPLLAGL